MADITPGNSPRGKKKGRRTLNQIRLDMTPMVDLAFLLLTFFILATTLNLAKTMEVVYPKQTSKTMPVSDSLANTFLIGEKDNQVYYYPGKFKLDSTRLVKVGMNGDELMNLIAQRNRLIIDKVNALKDKYRTRQINKDEYVATRKVILGDSKAPFFIIKTGDKSKYKEVVNILDCLNNSEANKYAVVDISESETDVLKKTLAAN